MLCIHRNFFNAGRTAFLGIQLFWHAVHIATGTTLSKGCSHIKVCQISLISPFYCKGFGEEMGAEKRLNSMLQHITAKTGNRLQYLAMCWFALYFLVSTALNLDPFWLDILTACICYSPYKFHTGKQALSMPRGGLSCLLQGARKGYFGVT